jgi:hypothetical protein
MISLERFALNRITAPSLTLPQFYDPSPNSASTRSNCATTWVAVRFSTG